MPLGKNNYTNKLISTLEVNGKFVKDHANISKAQTNFYQNFYSERLNEQNANYQNSLDEFLTNNEMPKFNNEEKIFCDRSICEALRIYPQAKLLALMVYQLIFNPSKDSKYDVKSENWRPGFCFAVPAFCGQPKLCSGNLHPAPLILFLFHNKW